MVIEIFLSGEILFLAWGIKVCYNVRNAESLFNEARLISYAIYNIAAVNITMIAIQYEFLFYFYIFPTLLSNRVLSSTFFFAVSSFSLMLAQISNIY